MSFGISYISEILTFGLLLIKHDLYPLITRYYSHEDGVCKDFLYKGERGNRNRFLTRQTCESSCFEAQDVCELPKVGILGIQFSFWAGGWSMQWQHGAILV